MGQILRRKALVRPPASGPAPLSTFRIPMRVQADIPAGFAIPIHEDSFSVGAPHNDALWSNCQTDGGDIRAYSDSGLTVGEPLELISIDTVAKNIKGYFHTTSALTNGQDIFLGCSGSGGSLTQPAVTDPLGRNAVWPNEEQVMHGHVSGGQFVDSTGNYTTTRTGVVELTSNLPNGWPCIGSGPSPGFGSGGTDRVLSGITAHHDIRSVSMILWFTNIGERFWSKGEDNCLYSPGADQVGMEIPFTGPKSWHTFIKAGMEGQYQHIVVQYDMTDANNDPEYYVDGVLQTLAADINQTLAHTVSTSQFVWGNRHLLDKAIRGKYGACRLRIGSGALIDAAHALLESNSILAPASVVQAQALVTA